MNILLICSAGMSTSVLVSKMEKVAKAKGNSHKIWAISEAVIGENIDKADVVLLAPQIRFLYDEVKKQASGKPVEIISMVHYGTCNGEEILKHAENMSIK